MKSPPSPRRAAFIDRDGTLIRNKGYICEYHEVEIFPFSIEALKILNSHDFQVFVISNQSAVARGICSENQVRTIHDKLRSFFLKSGAEIKDFYYCPFHKDAIIQAYRQDHEWRKPAPGMIHAAALKYHIDLVSSITIGDNSCDIQAGKNAGCRTGLVLTGHGREARLELERLTVSPDIIADNLLDVVNRFIGTV